ncbi:MAG: DUF3179 domain-containing protein [Alphaproteobacteria bacterium]|nr:DUF3179 domain-containing protein [Alphaproteobacteria bacterium]
MPFPLRPLLLGLIAGAIMTCAVPHARADGLADWKAEFPKTNFSRTAIDLSEIDFDGPTRDMIVAIDAPTFRPVSEIGEDDIGPQEPVLSIDIDGDRRAYPLRMMLWHEIVNDTVGGVPVLVTFCPLCNSGSVFDRRVDGQELRFGNTGRLRHFDMVMYDDVTESWWQQFLGEAIVGEMKGARLKVLPARLESVERFRARAPDGKLMVPENPMIRPYGMTPHTGKDGSKVPASWVPYPLPEGVKPYDRVVVVGEQAWLLSALRRRKTLKQGELELTWIPGQNSVHDTEVIAESRDVGNVVVRRKTPAGLQDVPYDVTFAFTFRAFRPDGKLHLE